MSIIMIACTDINMGIANAKGELLFDLPKDMAHFKSVTTNKHVVMGRKTWDSLPVKPLPKRKNYVLTSKEIVIEDATVLNSLDEVVQMSKKKDVYIIGGGEIYNQFIGLADELIITHVHVIDGSAKVFFPEIDFQEWELTNVKVNEVDKKHAHRFTFANYKRKATREELLAKMLKAMDEENSTQE